VQFWQKKGQGWQQPFFTTTRNNLPLAQTQNWGQIDLIPIATDWGCPAHAPCHPSTVPCQRGASMRGPKPHLATQKLFVFRNGERSGPQGGLNVGSNATRRPNLAWGTTTKLGHLGPDLTKPAQPAGRAQHARKHHEKRILGRFQTFFGRSQIDDPWGHPILQ
jgi:hypothetical protein